MWCSRGVKAGLEGEGSVADNGKARRPVATYSVAVRDGSGALGVAVQSHWFNVGAVVPWVEAGAGAVAVQSISDPSTGPRALGLLRSGHTADAVLEAVLRGGPHAGYRQIAVVDAHGRVATHTGALCIAEAGHEIGDGISVQANLMDSSTVGPGRGRGGATPAGASRRRSWGCPGEAKAQVSISGWRTRAIRSASSVGS